MTMPFRILNLFTLLLAVLVTAPTTSALAIQDESSEYIQVLGDELVQVLHENGGNRAAIEEKLFEVLSRNIDIEHIARLVVGKYWSRADDEQKARFIEAYRPFLVKTYSQRFSANTGETFAILSTREESNGTTMVRSEIERKSAENIPVDFRVRKEGDKLKVYDVIIAGVSQLQTQRSEFYSIIERKGLDNLIARLDKRVRQLSSAQ